ncbi:MAG: glycine oxidase ThiO [Candidatus Acidiferrales bacterium]
MTFDVAIVGGGLIGSSIAFELAREKLRLVVLDRQEPGREASWAAAGMLSPAPDGPPSVPLIPLAMESLALYPRFVAEVEEVSGERTDYEQAGALHLFVKPEGIPQRDAMIAEYRHLGLDVAPIEIAGARERESAIGPGVQAAAWHPSEASVDPRKLTNATIAAARRRGVEIRGGAAVSAILTQNGRCQGVVVDGEKIAARHIVLAAGCYSGTIANAHHGACAPTVPVRGQLMALRKEGLRLGCVVRSDRGYLVPRSDGRVVAGSTLEHAGFQKQVTPEGLRKIMDAAAEMIPALADAEIVETWAGLRPGSPDELPILGPTRTEGLLAATGHYRNGILLAPVTAKLVREWILERPTTMDFGIFSPLRFEKQASGADAAR